MAARKIQFRLNDKSIDDAENERSDPIALVQLLLSGEDSGFGIKKRTNEVASNKQSACSSIVYRDKIVTTVKFLIHFFLVMLLLFFGAMVFANIEDPEDYKDPYSRENKTCTEHAVHNSTNLTLESLETSLNVKTRQKCMHLSQYFWREIQLKYNLSFRDSEQKDAFLNDITTYIKMKEDRQVNEEYKKMVKNRKLIFMKWFYFVTVATTTIGYGDVYPRTNMGKLFYIFFSVIGIILMMSLLKSCGAILTAINKRFYHVVVRYLYRNKKIVSEELLSVISMLFVFVCYLMIGVWHGKMIKTVNWSIVDVVYFWIVTFTTVGFGDIVHPLNVELEHVYDLVLYRVFGLTILAAIIDSLCAYIKLKKKILHRDTIKFSERRKMLLERTLASLRKSDLLEKYKKQTLFRTISDTAIH